MNRSAILKILKNYKKKNSDRYNILLLGVFGSVARDDANELSDVDVVIKTKIPDAYNIVHIKEDLELKLHKRVDIVRVRDNMNGFLKKQIENEAIYV